MDARPPWVSVLGMEKGISTSSLNKWMNMDEHALSSVRLHLYCQIMPAVPDFSLGSWGRKVSSWWELWKESVIFSTPREKSVKTKNLPLLLIFLNSASKSTTRDFISNQALIWWKGSPFDFSLSNRRVAPSESQGPSSGEAHKDSSSP